MRMIWDSRIQSLWDSSARQRDIFLMISDTLIMENRTKHTLIVAWCMAYPKSTVGNAPLGVVFEDGDFARRPESSLAGPSSDDAAA